MVLLWWYCNSGGSVKQSAEYAYPFVGVLCVYGCCDIGITSNNGKNNNNNKTYNLSSRRAHANVYCFNLRWFVRTQRTIPYPNSTKCLNIEMYIFWKQLESLRRQSRLIAAQRERKVKVKCELSTKTYIDVVKATNIKGLWTGPRYTQSIIYISWTELTNGLAVGMCWMIKNGKAGKRKAILSLDLIILRSSVSLPRWESRKQQYISDKL